MAVAAEALAVVAEALADVAEALADVAEALADVREDLALTTEAVTVRWTGQSLQCSMVGGCWGRGFQAGSSSSLPRHVGPMFGCQRHLRTSSMWIHTCQGRQSHFSGAH